MPIRRPMQSSTPGTTDRINVRIVSWRSAATDRSDPRHTAVLQKEKAPRGLPAGHFPVNRTFVLLVVAAPAVVLAGSIRLERLMGFVRGRQAGGQIHRL